MNRILQSFLIFALAGFWFEGSSQIVTTNYNGCPNQIINVSVSWPNTQITSLSLTPLPPGASAFQNGNLGTATQFTVSTPVTNTFTICGTGVDINGPVNSCTFFVVTVTPPPALQINNQVFYCQGATATVEAASGGFSYNMHGSNNINILNNQSNIFSIPNLGTQHSGVYTITSIGSCTATGVTTINVAPNAQLSTNSTSNVCEGGSANLTANMIGALGQDWAWYAPPVGTQIFPANFPNVSISNLDINSAGIYTVTANQHHNGQFCQKVATVAINVVETESVTVTASPANIICQNDKLALQANGGPNAVSYAWQGPGGYTSSSSNPTINPVNPSHAGTYSVTALFSNGFTTCPMSGSVFVQIVPITVPVINMLSTVCQGTQVPMSATAGTNVAGWEWFGPGFSASTQSTKIDTVLPNHSGTYYVTAKYSMGTTTCAATSIPHQLNVVQVYPVTVLPAKDVCQPDNAYLNASSNGANSYKWEGPNGFAAPGANATVYYPTPASSGIYTVTAFFGGGNIACPKSNTVSLKVFPVLNFTLIPRQMACYNSSVVLSGPSGANSYTWTSITGHTSFEKDVLFPSIQPANAGSYTVQVSLGPCVSGASTSIEVLTPIEFTLTPGSRTLCAGMPTTLEGGVKGGSQNYAYVWNPAVYMDSPFGPQKTIVPDGTINYNLLVHDIACPQFSVSHPFLVEVLKAPTPVFKIPSARACAPFCGEYTVTTNSQAWITTFDFGGTLQRQSDSSFVQCLNDPGTYTLTVYTKDATHGCLGTYVYPEPIVVNPRPGADIIWNPEQPTTMDEITFHATERTGPIISKGWIFSGGESLDIHDSLKTKSSTDTSDFETPRRKYENFGRYPVTVISTNEYECTDSVTRFVDVIDAMNIYIPNSFTPNGDGVNDVFGVKGQGVKDEAFLFEIRNRSGKLIFSTRNINESWDGTYKGEKAQDGVYVYIIRAVGMNGEGRKEFTGHFSLIK